MKLLYAGTVIGEVIPSWTNILFNCSRNKKCQRAFYVPIKQFSDLVLYVDLPGVPSAIDAAFIASPTEQEYVVNFNTYVVAQQPSQAWYGVFGNAVPMLNGDTLTCFFVRMIFTINGTEHVYYSEQIVVEQCEELTFVRACYPNILTGADARDCNGVYYGFHAGEEEPLGNVNYRYFHWAYVRFGDITENRAKLSFTLFNSRINYKTTVEQESLFTFELVPAFFKRILMGIFSLGNIQINGTEYTLSEEQDFQITDPDSKLWRMDVTLKEHCEQSFDCGPRDCALLECCDPVVTGATVETQDTPNLRIQNVNSGMSITGIFTWHPPFNNPQDTRPVTAVGGYPIPNGQQRDGSIHPDHNGRNDLIVIVYTDQVVGSWIYLKVTDSDNTVACGQGNNLAQLVQTLDQQRLNNGETWSIRLSNEVCP